MSRHRFEATPNKTAVDTIMVGRERVYNRRFQQMCSHYLADRCVAYARAPPHPEFRDRTLRDVFEEERPSLIRYVGRSDGFHAAPASVSKTCPVRFDNNEYSVSAHAVGRPVEIRAYAERIEIRQDGRVVGDHPRSFGCDQTMFDHRHFAPMEPWPASPGALRNGAPFRDWVLPPGLERMRRSCSTRR